MAKDWFTPVTPNGPDRAAVLDTTVAHPGRVYDCWLGGKDNFAADREAAEQVIAANPNVLPGVRANRAFLGRAGRCGPWPVRRGYASSWTSAPGCRRLTTLMRSRSGSRRSAAAQSRIPAYAAVGRKR
jgi:S-adenosyl methyltransferase